MKKIIIFNLIIIITPVIAGLYGVLHDQLTYTISPEYYTKFKFYQFGLMNWDHETVILNPRLAAAKVGFLATWWTGIFIGIALAITAWSFKDLKTMVIKVSAAMAITIGVTFSVGLTGLIYGKFVLAHTGVSWPLPDDLLNKENFIVVGSIHNFSYFGGLIGLVVAITYLIKQKVSKADRQHSE